MKDGMIFLKVKLPWFVMLNKYCLNNLDDVESSLYILYVKKNFCVKHTSDGVFYCKQYCLVFNDEGVERNYGFCGLYDYYKDKSVIKRECHNELSTIKFFIRSLVYSRYKFYIERITEIHSENNDTIIYPVEELRNK